MITLLVGRVENQNRLSAPTRRPKVTPTSIG